MRALLLAIDCGNTNTVFAIHDGERWRAQWRAATYTSRTADEYAVWLSQLMGIEGVGFSDLSACVVSSVVPQSLFNLRNLSRRYLKVEPLVVGEPGVRTGISIRIDRPEEVGADRLVNAVGARLATTGAILIVDSGTATTFDVVSEDGAFDGGVICPGINLSLQALHEAAAKLPRIEIRRPAHVIGKSTVPAMQSGVFWGYVELIDGLVVRIKDEYGKPMTVLGTGGVASLFEGACRRIDRFEPDLTINGLLEIWRRNSGKI
jgi:type III pantothenate kinase